MQTQPKALSISEVGSSETGVCDCGRIDLLLSAAPQNWASTIRRRRAPRAAVLTTAESGA